MTQPAAPHPDDLLTAKEICKLLKISRRTFCRMRELGRIPMPVVQTSRTTMRWRRGDVLAILDPAPPPHTNAGRIAVASTHVRAAAMNARSAAMHADAAAACLRQLLHAAAPEPNKIAAAYAEGAD